MISTIFQYFPKFAQLPDFLNSVLSVFISNDNEISSIKHEHASDKVLHLLQKDLQEINYVVEKSKKRSEKISIPVLFGMNGKIEKSFDVDAFNKDTKTIIEVEAGRGVTNYQFLKDLFEACMMHDVDYLVIAVRKIYKGKKDFEYVKTFFETMFNSKRLELPLKGILIIGY